MPTGIQNRWQATGPISITGKLQHQMPGRPDRVSFKTKATIPPWYILLWYTQTNVCTLSEIIITGRMSTCSNENVAVNVSKYGSPYNCELLNKLYIL